MPVCNHMADSGVDRFSFGTFVMLAPTVLASFQVLTFSSKLPDSSRQRYGSKINKISFLFFKSRSVKILVLKVNQ